MKYMLTAALILATLYATAQTGNDTSAHNGYAKGNNTRVKNPPKNMDKLPLRHRPVLWFTPVMRSTVINGIALGIFAGPAKRTLVINGVNIEANPAALVLWFFEFWGGIFGPFNVCKDGQGRLAYLFKNEYPIEDTPVHAVIRGVSVSTTQLGGKMDGIGINLLSSWAGETNGLEVSGLMNLHYNFNGALISWRNKTIHGKGVQIGIFNECKEGRLVQIGLFNRIGKRVIPFVNFSFKRHRTLQ